MTGRLDRMGNATVSALRLVPVAGEPGHMSPGKLATGLAHIIRARLVSSERLLVASAGMLSLGRNAAEELAEATLADLREGVPVPPFTGLRDEARDWASFASQGEVRAYLAACWNRLPKAERASFKRVAT